MYVNTRLTTSAGSRSSGPPKWSTTTRFMRPGIHDPDRSGIRSIPQADQYKTACAALHVGNEAAGFLLPPASVDSPIRDAASHAMLSGRHEGGEIAASSDGCRRCRETS